MNLARLLLLHPNWLWSCLCVVTFWCFVWIFRIAITQRKTKPES